MGLHALPSQSLLLRERFSMSVEASLITTVWTVDQCINFSCSMKKHHQSRTSCTSWVSLSSLKRSAGDLYVYICQKRRGDSWSFARDRAMLAKMVRPSSLITPLHIGHKATFAAWASIICTVPLGNEIIDSLVSNVMTRWMNTCVHSNWHYSLTQYKSQPLQ